MEHDAWSVDSGAYGRTFGPDAAGRLTLISLPAVAVLGVVIVGVSVPLALGPATVLAALASWYAWRAGMATKILVRPDGLRIVTPLRDFRAPWKEVESIGGEGGVRIRISDGTVFSTSQASYPAIGGSFLADHTREFRRRRAVHEAIRDAWEASRDRPTSGPVETLWVRPSTPALFMTGVVAAVAEICGVLLTIV